MMPPPPQPQTFPQKVITWARKHPIWAGVIALLVVSILAAPFTGTSETEPTAKDDTSSETKKDDAGDKAEKSKAPKGSEAPAKPKTPRQLVEEAVDDLDVEGAKVSDETTPRDYVIEFEVSDNLTNDMIRTGADNDAKEILEAVAKADPKLRSVGIRGLFPLVDDYGEESKGQVYWAYFPRAVVQRINWDNLDVVELETIADAYALHPDMRD